MTGFFSTAELHTAAFELAADIVVIVAFVPAEIFMAPSLGAVAGATVVAPALMLSEPVLTARAGALVITQGQMTAIAPLSVSIGAIVLFEPQGFSFTFEPLETSTGGMAGFYNDLPVYSFPSTASFSTGLLPDGFQLFRVAHEWQMQYSPVIRAGARVTVDGAMNISPVPSEPVVRSRRVRSQMVVS